MNVLELQLLIVVSGIPEGRVGPTLMDSPNVPVDRRAPEPAKVSASSDRTPPQS
jgi:hypothetical protein